MPGPHVSQKHEECPGRKTSIRTFSHNMGRIHLTMCTLLLSPPGEHHSRYILHRRHPFAPIYLFEKSNSHEWTMSSSWIMSIKQSLHVPSWFSFLRYFPGSSSFSLLTPGTGGCHFNSCRLYNINGYGNELLFKVIEWQRRRVTVHK